MVLHLWGWCEISGTGKDREQVNCNIYLCVKTHYFSLLGTDVASPNSLTNVLITVNNFLVFHVSPSTWGLDMNLRCLLHG